MAYDACVIGAGIEGSACAYYLLKKGLKNVLLLEQFSAIHSRGSSHGPSRIIRRAYVQPYYVKMMNDAYTLWKDFEKESGTTLYTRTGIIVFGPSDSKDVQSVAESLASNDVAHDVFSGREANARYPHQLRLPDDYMCVYEDGGGFLNSQKALMTFQRQFQSLGGTLLENHEVVKIHPGGAVVTVVTSRGTFRARDLVIAAGTWTPALTSPIGLHLPFKLIRSEVNYWKVDEATVFTPERLPVLIGYSDTDKSGIHYYSIPIAEYPGLVKVCAHGGAVIDSPDCRDSIGGPTTVPGVAKFISNTFQGVANKPSITEYCMYTVSPDYNPVIDRHPKYSNIFIAAGFSGHGFKLSPIVGTLIAELITGTRPSHDLTHFRVARFQPPKSSL